MKIEQFNKIVNAQFEESIRVLCAKGDEYAPGADRLSHFKHTAAFMGTNQKAALFAMLAKHLISLSEMCSSDKEFSIERWNEKITDSINYLTILRAMVAEDNDGK